MFAVSDQITDEHGNAQANWQFELVVPGTATQVALYADYAGTTPIGNVSYITNRAVSDAYGNVEFYVAEGVWTKNVYDKSGTLRFTFESVDYGSLRADLALPTGARLSGYGANGTVADQLDNKVWGMSAIPPAEYAAIRNHTTTYNATAAIQSLIDSVSAAGGGVIELPDGKFIVGDLVLKPGVIIAGVGQFGFGYLGTGATKKSVLQMAPGATWIIDTPVGGALSAGVVGFDFLGLGAGTTPACGGVRIRAGSGWCVVSSCHFNNFGEQAILNEGIATRIYDCLAINTVLNRTRAALTGVLEDKGTDTYIHHCQMNAGLVAGTGESGIVNITDLATFTGDISTASRVITNISSLTNLALGNIVRHASIPVGARVIRLVSANSVEIDVLPTATAASVTITPRRPDLFICGILAAGANGFISDSNGEFCERGIHSTVSYTKIIGCRGDRNAGHGLTGTAVWVGCVAGDNSAYASGLWDNFNGTGSQGGISDGCRAYKVGAAQPRYDFVALGTFGAISLRWQVNAFRPSYGALIAAILNDAALPHDIRPPAHYTTGTGATPDVANVGMYVPTDAAPITVTDFLNGVYGQDLYVRGNANVTVQHGASTIVLPGSVNMPMLAGGLYHFKRDATVWRLVSRPYASSAAIASPAGGATIDAQSRTAIDAIRAALTAAGITL